MLCVSMITLDIAAFLAILSLLSFVESKQDLIQRRMGDSGECRKQKKMKSFGHVAVSMGPRDFADMQFRDLKVFGWMKPTKRCRGGRGRETIADFLLTGTFISLR